MKNKPATTTFAIHLPVGFMRLLDNLGDGLRKYLLLPEMDYISLIDNVPTFVDRFMSWKITEDILKC